MDFSSSCAIKWKLYKFPLGADETPNNAMLENQSLCQLDIGEVVKVTKNGELFLCCSFYCVFHLYFIYYISFSMILFFKLFVVKLDV